jgi:GcrA cell cycle regulator
MTWTAARIDLLRDLCAEGLSFAQIAKQLNEVSRERGPLSRSAVAGKIARFGIKKATFAGAPRIPVKRIRPPRSRPSQPNSNERARVEAARGGIWTPHSKPHGPVPITSTTPVVEAAQRGGGVKLLDLTLETCRWPVGDPRDFSFRFCGALSPVDKPYCGHHTLAARGDGTRSERHAVKAPRPDAYVANNSRLLEVEGA